MPSFGMSAYVGHIVRMLLVDRSWLSPRFLVQLCVRKDAFGAICIFFHDSWESENILKIQKIRSVWPSFGRSGRRLSSGGRIPRGTCSCICAHVIFTIAHVITLAIVCAIVFRDRVHDRTNDLFNRSRVRTPGLVHDLFCRSRVRFPDPIVCFRPIVSVAYVTPAHFLSSFSIFHWVTHKCIAPYSCHIIIVIPTARTLN